MEMKRSPLNTPRGNQTYNTMRHTPYSWKSYNKGYHPVEDDRNQRCFVNNEQPYEDNFIPLNVSTPVGHYKKQSTNQYISPSNHNNSNSGWSNYRNNYHVAYGKCNNRYPANKHFGKQFYGNYQKRKVSFDLQFCVCEITEILSYDRTSFHTIININYLQYVYFRVLKE